MAKTTNIMIFIFTVVSSFVNFTFNFLAFMQNTSFYWKDLKYAKYKSGMILEDGGSQLHF